jgi:hypothetical protein
MNGRWFKVQEVQGSSTIREGQEMDWGVLELLIEDIQSIEDSCTVYKRDGYYRVVIKTADSYIRLHEIDS